MPTINCGIPESGDFGKSIKIHSGILGSKAVFTESQKKQQEYHNSYFYSVLLLGQARLQSSFHCKNTKTQTLANWALFHFTYAGFETQKH